MKTKTKFAIMSCGLLALASCSEISLPASGVTSDSVAWTGYFTMKKFEISGDGTICEGMPPMGTAKIQTATFNCNDGRTGTITTNRTSMRGGQIEAIFSDGTTGKFTYGS